MTQSDKVLINNCIHSTLMIDHRLVREMVIGWLLEVLMTPFLPLEMTCPILMDNSLVPGDLIHKLKKIMSPVSRDRDQDSSTSSPGHCAEFFTGGWWYKNCYNMHPTGQHTTTKSTISGQKQIVYHHGGARGNTHNSWAEAEFLLLPKWTLWWWIVDTFVPFILVNKNCKNKIFGYCPERVYGGQLPPSNCSKWGQDQESLSSERRIQP